MCRSSSRNTGSKYGQTAVRLKVQIAMLRRLARCTSRPAVPHMERRKLEDADGISREEVPGLAVFNGRWCGWRARHPGRGHTFLHQSRVLSAATE